MVQRILERGQIETLARRDIPRILLPAPDALFRERAARLRALAPASALGSYLQLLAVVADAQQAAYAALTPAEHERLRACGGDARADAARQAGMPPLPANRLSRDPCWHAVLQRILADGRGHPAFPPAAAALLERLAGAAPDWLEAQADAVLEVAAAAEPDVAAAPFVMAALQVLWTALRSGFDTASLAPLADAPGLCPCCGTPPVASIVHAKGAEAGYRFLACPLCACQWHRVRVQCSRCGADGKDLAYHALTGIDAVDDSAVKEAAVRAETCSRCKGYRKILYAEKDMGVEAVADDLASHALDVLLAEQGFERMSGNPLLWPDAER